MQDKKRKIDQLRDKWEAISLRMRRSQSKIYFLWFFEIVLFFCLIFGLRLTVKEVPKFDSTKEGTTFQLLNNTYELVASKTDYATHKLSFHLANQSLETTLNEDKWKVSLAYLNSNQTEVEAKVQTVIGENNYLFVYADNLPDKWETVKVTVTLSSDEREESEELYISQHDKKSSSITLLKQKDVTLQSIAFMKEQREKLVKDITKEQETYRQFIQDMEKKIKQLEAGLSFETEKQQASTKSQITQLESSITQAKSDSDNIQLDADEYQLQIEKLEEKRGNVEENN